MAIMKQPSSFKELEEMTELFCLLAIFVLSDFLSLLSIYRAFTQNQIFSIFFSNTFFMPPVATFSNNTYATTFFASLKRLRIADGNA